MVVVDPSFKEYCEETVGKPFNKLSDDRKIALRQQYNEFILRSVAPEQNQASFTWINPNDTRYFLHYSSKVWLVSAVMLTLGLGSYSACFSWNGLGTIANLIAGLGTEAYTIVICESHLLWWNYKHQNILRSCIMLYNTSIYWIVSLPLQVIRLLVWCNVKLHKVEKTKGD